MWNQGEEERLGNFPRCHRNHSLNSKAHGSCGRGRDLCLVSLWASGRLFPSYLAMRLSSGQCAGSRGHLWDFQAEAIQSSCSLSWFTLPLLLVLQSLCFEDVSVSRWKNSKSEFMEVTKEILPTQIFLWCRQQRNLCSVKPLHFRMYVFVLTA